VSAKAGTLVALALLALAGAQAATASYDPIAGGSAKLTLDPSFSRLLKKNGVKVQGREGAKPKGRVVTFPVVGGIADPTIAKADIELGGEMVLAAGAKRVPFTQLSLKTKPTPLFAKLGGGQLKIVKAGKVSLKREGFGNGLTATRLKLTAKVATRLNKRLDLEVFRSGQLVGAVKASTQPRTAAVLPSGKVTIAVDPAMAAKLDGYFVSLNPIFPTERTPAGFTIPIGTEGAIAPDASSGTVRTVGALEFLRLGGGQVFWRDPWVELTSQNLLIEVSSLPSPPLPGEQGPLPAVGFSRANVGSDPAARQVGLQGAALALDGATAALFNQAFAEGAPAFVPGELFGSLSFTAQTQ